MLKASAGGGGKDCKVEKGRRLVAAFETEPVKLLLGNGAMYLSVWFIQLVRDLRSIPPTFRWSTFVSSANWIVPLQRNKPLKGLRRKLHPLRLGVKPFVINWCCSRSCSRVCRLWKCRDDYFLDEASGNFYQEMNTVRWTPSHRVCYRCWYREGADSHCCRATFTFQTRRYRPTWGHAIECRFVQKIQHLTLLQAQGNSPNPHLPSGADLCVKRLQFIQVIPFLLLYSMIAKIIVRWGECFLMLNEDVTGTLWTDIEGVQTNADFQLDLDFRTAELSLVTTILSFWVKLLAKMWPRNRLFK